MSEPTTVTVQIHGTEYKLRGENSELIREAADTINEQMRRVSSKTPTQPVSTLVVLAALNTAELMLTERDRQTQEAAGLVRRIDMMTESIQELLEKET